MKSIAALMTAIAHCPLVEPHIRNRAGFLAVRFGNRDFFDGIFAGLFR